MEEVAIHTEFIQLDQFLKWVGIIESGGQVKFMIDGQEIMINNKIATERRKKLYPGDIVEVAGVGLWKVSAL